MSDRSLTPVQRIALARSISVAGTEAAHVALVALVLERTGSAAWVAGALLAMIGVSGLASLPAGLVGDRLDRRRVMIGSDLAAAACFCALAPLSDPRLIVGVAALAALCESPFIPASQAVVPSLVSDAALPAANATLTKWKTMGFIAGPIAGGVMVAVLGPAWAFWANAASFLACAVLVAGVRGDYRAVPAAPGARYDGLMAGIRLVASDRVMRTLTIAFTIFMLGVGVVLVAELPLAQRFGVGSVGYGMLAAGWGAGALAGAHVSRRVLAQLSEVTAVLGGLVLMGLGLAAGAVSPSFAAVVAGMAVGGLGDAVLVVAWQTLLQRRAPDALRSRVIAATGAAETGAIGASFIAGGALVAALGPRPAYLAAAMGSLAAAALVATLRRGPGLEAVVNPEPP
jgi:MFS family permease